MAVGTTNPNNYMNFGIPCATRAEFTYVGTTNNIETATYYNQSGSVVGVLEFTYVNSGAADDDKVATVERTT